MGAGAVAFSGLLTLLRTLPTIVSALKGTFSKKALSFRGEAEESAVAAREASPSRESATPLRTEHDLPNSVVYGGSLLLVLIMWAFLQFKPVPGAQVGALANLAAALLVVVFGFLFVTVSSRIVGIVGSSASPVSGMTIATLMATTAIFLVNGWTAPAFGALAITIGGIVCIAASNSGDVSQDLKTGYLIGATPWKQQLAVMIGSIVSIFVIGLTLSAMNTGLEEFRPMPHAIAFNLNALPEGVQDKGHFTRPHINLTEKPGAPRPAFEDVGSATTNSSGKTEINNATHYILLNAIGSSTLEDGKYLYNPDTHQIEIQWIQGIGSEKAAAPQGRLMATVINGILSHRLPWGLVLLGVALVAVVELLGIRSLTFAVGAYLPLSTTLAIFTGGLIRWLADKAVANARAKSTARTLQDLSFRAERSEAEESAVAASEARPSRESANTDEDLADNHIPDAEEISPGSLYASGLIAAGGIVGLLGVGFRLIEGFSEQRGGHWLLPRFSEHNPLHRDPVAVLMFALLAFSLYYFARKPLETK
jgi:hypothetical protein